MNKIIYYILQKKVILLLRHDLINKSYIIQFLTFTILVMVFFIPQNTYAASFGTERLDGINIDISLIISAATVLIAVFISYILFGRNQRRNAESVRILDMPDIVRDMLGTMAQTIQTAFIALDAEGSVLYLNSAACDILGYSREEANAITLSSVFDEPSMHVINKLALDSDNKTAFNAYTRIKTKNGTWLDMISSISYPKNSYSGKMGTIILLKQKEALEEMSVSADLTVVNGAPLENNLDMLTELPNRKQFIDYLGSILTNKATASHKYALMLINLDFFRSINNNLGYEVGDIILKVCAERLRSLFADNGFLARMDGDEFGLILKTSGSDDIENIANKIFESMKEPVVISNQEIFISVSIGISYFPDQGKSSSEIIRNAASSVNVVKNTRRGSYKVFTADISRYNFQKFNIHAELRQALERKEFVLYYQPKIDSKTSHLVGIEALIRWNHPERGLLYPIDFIPVAEETGIIKYIDEWVLHTACSQLKTWIEEGITNMRLAVNLSAWQFKDQHLVETVSKVLAETGISPSLLELEITETAAIENINFTQNTLAKLIKMGVIISIDDFGTGYSSLNYLKNFPINFLKIDKSFVADIIKDPNTYSIVRAIIEVAHALKLKVIAEGVENKDQLELLNKLGCDEVQGYLISKPLTVEDIKKAFMEERNTDKQD